MAEVYKILPNSFFFFRPKDIVSGDFYWIEKKNDVAYFAASDCTGHGVPGAFMSIIGHNGLDHALTFCDTPAEILNALNQSLSRSLHQATGESETKDGMDIALCSYNVKTRVFNYAGGFNPLYLVRDGELQITKADKFPIGSHIDEELQKFTNHTLQLQKGDMIYVCSDGFQDQFGGPRGKKYMVGRMKRLLTEIAVLEVNEQRDKIKDEFESWKGDEEQVDDILIIGLKITS